MWQREVLHVQKSESLPLVRGGGTAIAVTERSKPFAMRYVI